MTLRCFHLKYVFDTEGHSKPECQVVKAAWEKYPAINWDEKRKAYVNEHCTKTRAQGSITESCWRIGEKKV